MPQVLVRHADARRQRQLHYALVEGQIPEKMLSPPERESPLDFFRDGFLDFGPSENSAPAGRHACVVVQSDIFNLSRLPTTLVCLITSNLTIDKTELTDRIGKLPSPTIDSIRTGLQLLFDRA